MLMTRCLFSLIILSILFSFNITAQTFPEYQADYNVTVTSVSDHKRLVRAREEADRQSVEEKHEVFTRSLTKFKDNNTDKWLLYSLLSLRKEQGGYEDFGIQPKVIVYYYDADQLITEALKKEGEAQTKTINLDQESLQRVTNIAQDYTYYNTLIHMVSTHDYKLKKSISLNKEELKQHFIADSGEIQLVSLQTKWQQSVANFQVTTASQKLEEKCTYNFSILVKNGKPITLNKSCYSQGSAQKVNYYLVETLIRNYSYSDQEISQLSPNPVPQSQPSGELLSLQYSDENDQLILLTQQMLTDEKEISFYDVRQNKIIKSLKGGGDKLQLSENGHFAFDIDTKFSSMQAWVPIDHKLTRFGYVSPVMNKPGILDTSVVGVYPLTVDEQHQLQIWNLGYQKSTSYDLGEVKAEVIAYGADNKLITLNKNGNVGLYHFKINTNACENKRVNAYCEGVIASLSPLEQIYTIDIGWQKEGEAEAPTITRLIAHPSKSLVIFCSESISRCGALNYKTQEVVLNNIFNMADFNGNEIITANARYTLEGQLIKRYQNYGLPSKQIAVSNKRNVVFKDDYDWNKVDHNGFPSGINVLVNDIETGKTLTTLTNDTVIATDLHVLSDGVIALIAPGAQQTSIHLYSLKDLKHETMKVPFATRKVAFNSQWILFTSNETNILGDFKGNTLPPISGAFSDFKLTEDNLFYAQGKQIHRLNLKDKTNQVVHSLSDKIIAFELFDEQGDKLVAQLMQGKFELPHINKILSLPYYGAQAKRSITYSESLKQFFVSGLIGYSSAFNPNIPMIQAFNESGDTVMEMFPVWNKIEMMQTNTHNELWAGTQSGEIIIFDILSGLIKERISKAHLKSLKDIKQYDQGRMLSSGADGSVKLWHIGQLNESHYKVIPKLIYQSFLESDIGQRQSKLALTINTDVNDDHIISTADGYYMATPKALHKASFINNEAILDYNRFDFWLNRPDIILKRLGFEESSEIKMWQRIVDIRKKRFPNRLAIFRLNEQKLTIKAQGPKKLVQAGNVVLNYQITGEIDNSKKLMVSVNQVPIDGVEGRRIDGNNGSITLSLSNGKNKIKLTVVDAQGRQSNSQFFSYYRETPEPVNLYVLAVGVSDYRHDGVPDLDYAAKDAKDITAAFTNSADFHSVTVKTLTDAQATKDNILKAKTFLQQAKPQDQVVVFFAGHGFLDEAKNFYFGSSDIDPFDLSDKGLKYSEINYLLDGINARNKLLLLDSCHSGEVVENYQVKTMPEGVTSRGFSVKSAPKKEQDLAISFDLLQKTFIDLRDSTGAVVISAAGGLEYALELPPYKNGVFTASILKAFAEPIADENKDGKLSTSELRKYTYQKVTELTSGQQQPTTRAYNLDNDFIVY
jgi:hypothetical protein